MRCNYRENKLHFPLNRRMKYFSYFIKTTHQLRRQEIEFRNFRNGNGIPFSRNGFLLLTSDQIYLFYCFSSHYRQILHQIYLLSCRSPNYVYHFCFLTFIHIKSICVCICSRSFVCFRKLGNIQQKVNIRNELIFYNKKNVAEIKFNYMFEL